MSIKKNLWKILLCCLFVVMLVPMSVLHATDDQYTVTVINGNPNGGQATIAIKEGEDYFDTGLSSVSVPASTKVKIWYETGLNDGYTVYAWATVNESGLMTFVSEANGEKYVEEKFVKTINQDFTIYLYAISPEEHIVSFYNSALDARKSLLGMSMVKDHGNATQNTVSIPVQKGYTFTKWSQELTDVTEDMDVYPIYHSNVLTVLRDFYPLFIKGLLMTLLLSVVSVLLAMVGGMALCLVRLSHAKVPNFIATVYVEVIRGVPLLLQLLIVYVLLGPTRIHVGSILTTEMISCILTLFINSSAYVSEIFRSGIQAVDKGQMEAGRALGLSQWEVYQSVVIPQGLKNSLPALVNELIAMIKETSLAVNIDVSIGELMSIRSQITSATFIVLPAYCVVAIMYFVLTFSLSKAAGLLEKRMSARD